MANMIKHAPQFRAKSMSSILLVLIHWSSKCLGLANNLPKSGNNEYCVLFGIIAHSLETTTPRASQLNDHNIRTWTVYIQDKDCLYHFDTIAFFKRESWSADIQNATSWISSLLNYLTRTNVPTQSRPSERSAPAMSLFMGALISLPTITCSSSKAFSESHVIFFIITFSMVHRTPINPYTTGLLESNLLLWLTLRIFAVLTYLPTQDRILAVRGKQSCQGQRKTAQLSGFSRRVFLPFDIELGSMHDVRTYERQYQRIVRSLYQFYRKRSLCPCDDCQDELFKSKKRLAPRTQRKRWNALPTPTRKCLWQKRKLWTQTKYMCTSSQKDSFSESSVVR